MVTCSDPQISATLIDSWLQAYANILIRHATNTRNLFPNLCQSWESYSLFKLGKNLEIVSAKTSFYDICSSDDIRDFVLEEETIKGFKVLTMPLIFDAEMMEVSLRIEGTIYDYEKKFHWQ